MLAPIHPLQGARLAAIRRYALGERAHEGAFDGIVELAAQICHCPIALVSIVHEDDQRFEAKCGLDAWSTGLDASICSHAILDDDILEIPDARLDMRTRDNPLVTDVTDPLLFYAGAPIRTSTGLPLGSLCVLDRRPRRLGDDQRRGLRILADQVMQRLELHEALRQAETLRREVDHRVKNNLANVTVLARMASRSAKVPEVREALRAVEQRIQVMVELHAQLYSGAGEAETVETSSYLDRIVGYLQDMAPRGVAVDASLARLDLPGRRASALGVIANEMVSNACKHGYPEGRVGAIRLSGAPDGRGSYVLVCGDDGVGAAATTSGSGLGRRIMEASAAQLGGRIETTSSSDGGHVVRLAFPIDT